MVTHTLSDHCSFVVLQERTPPYRIATPFHRPRPTVELACKYQPVPNSIVRVHYAQALDGPVALDWLLDLAVSGLGCQWIATTRRPLARAAVRAGCLGNQNAGRSKRAKNGVAYGETINNDARDPSVATH